MAVGFYWQSMDQSYLELSLDSDLSAMYFLWDLLQDAGSSQEGSGLESSSLAIVR